MNKSSFCDCDSYKVEVVILNFFKKLRGHVSIDPLAPCGRDFNKEIYFITMFVCLLYFSFKVFKANFSPKIQQIFKK